MVKRENILTKTISARVSENFFELWENYCRINNIAPSRLLREILENYESKLII